MWTPLVTASYLQQLPNHIKLAATLTTTFLT